MTSQGLEFIAIYSSLISLLLIVLERCNRNASSILMRELPVNRLLLDGALPAFGPSLSCMFL